MFSTRVPRADMISIKTKVIHFMQEIQYLSYLLRLWPVKDGRRIIWRASLECSQTGNRIGFSDLEALFTFLEQTVQDTHSDGEAELERDSE